MSKSNNNIKPTIFLSLLIIGLMASLLIESSGPPLAIMGQIQHLDKLAHFLAFSGLGLLVCALAFTLNPVPTIPLLSMPLLIVGMFGIIEESFQMLIPGRQFDLLDLLADICGAIFAIMLTNLITPAPKASLVPKLELGNWIQKAPASRGDYPGSQAPAYPGSQAPAWEPELHELENQSSTSLGIKVPEAPASQNNKANPCPEPDTEF